MYTNSFSFVFFRIDVNLFRKSLFKWLFCRFLTRKQSLNVGKPFEAELQTLNDTYKWAQTTDIHDFTRFISDSGNILLTIGSGGSSSACQFISLLHQHYTGYPAKALTPLDSFYSIDIFRSSKVLIISASGKNNDILTVFKQILNKEPSSLLAICMRTSSKLAALSNENSISKILEYNIPSGKDGFLATNSLIAYFTIAVRAFHPTLRLPAQIEIPDVYKKELKDFLKKVINKETFLVLYAGWAQPVAFDIESKFVEAALANVQISDFRNFGHGRHHWLAKNGATSTVIVLTTKNDEKIADKTISLIPKNIPRFSIATEHDGPIATLELLFKSFYLVGEWGKLRKIDPGRPGVPEFGRKLYNLKYSSLYKGKAVQSLTDNEENAILKKTKLKSIRSLNKDSLQFWLNAYNDFIKKIRKETFGSIAFDFDGTLCPIENRREGISETVYLALERLLRKNIVIGIITGRGKSVKEDLQKKVPQEYWHNIIIGYYNGSQIASLTDNNKPDLTGAVEPNLELINSSLASSPKFNSSLEVTPRPQQLTIEAKRSEDWALIKNSLLTFISQLYVSDVKILESSHSIDIIPIHISKLIAVDACMNLAVEKGMSPKVLCVGDKGQWPGNDYQLLTAPYSLSVDEVSTDPETCWNLSRSGYRNCDSTLNYLSNISFSKKGFKIAFEE